MPPHTMSELMVQVEILAAEINKLKEENRSLADESHKLRVRLNDAVGWLEQLYVDHQRAICEALSIIDKEV